MPAGVKTTAEPLANELARQGSLPVEQTLDIVRQLARQIAQWHESGRLHLRIDAAAVTWESETRQAELLEPTDASRSFGGADGDDECCPPELLRASSVSIALDLAAAREALRAAGLPNVDPRRIDIYQLGTLLCCMLTGQSVSDFLSRPRVAAKVAREVRDLIERALGHDSQRAFQTADELLQALKALDASQTQALPNLAGSTRNDAKPDTKPSFVGVGAADTDAGRPAPAPLDDAALPFRKLGHYEIVGRLGRGGMGDVYQGYEPRLDRHVAIKVLPAEFSRQDEMVQRFYAEASAAAKLVHPNTVEIFFVGQDEVAVAEGQAPSTLHFFAMRFVEGESLAELLARRKKLNVEETLAIIEQALAGLSAAHRLGMVHRDIKPGNILIDRERQRVLLADFGLVKTLQAAASLTASGVIVGTVDYMAPEQGRGAAVDARADLYAIGVVLYQMLSGRLPFQADSATGLIFQHVYESAPPLHEVAPDVPRPLSDIVAKLMAKSPDARYQNVETLLSDLRAFHQGQPLPSAAASVSGTSDRPRTVIIPAPRFADESVLPATLTQLAVHDPWQRRRQAIRDFFLVPSAEVVQRIQTTEHQVDGAIAEFERRQASLGTAIREAASVAKELQTQQQIWQRAITDAEHRAANAPDDDTARSALAEKLRAERVLAELAEQLASQQTQLDEMRHKCTQVTATLERLRSQRDVLNARLKVARAQIHLAGGESQHARDARWFALIRWRNVGAAMLVLSVVGSVATLLTLATTRDVGETMFSASDAIDVKVHETLGAVSTMADVYIDPPNLFAQPFSGCDKHVLDLSVSPTGTHVAAATGAGTVFVWDAESGKLLHRLTEPLQSASALAFSSDGSILATGEYTKAGDSTLNLWDPRTGEFKAGFLGEQKAVNHLAFQPGGPLLAGNRVNEGITLWNYETRSVDGSLSTSDRYLYHLAFSPDGSLLMGLAQRGEILVWDVAKRSLLKSWFSEGSSDSSRPRPHFLADGFRILTAGPEGQFTIWESRTGRKIAQHGGLPSKAKSIALSSDDRWLAASDGKWITVLESQTGVARAVLPGHQTTALAFSPKGDQLFSAGGQPYVLRWATDFPTLTGRDPSREIAAGPLVALAPDKSLCLLSVGSQIGLWNYATRSPMLPLKTKSALDASRALATFSADCRRVAVLDGQGSCSVWDVVSGEHIASARITERAFDLNTRRLEFDTDTEVVWAANSLGVWRWKLPGTAPELWLEWPSQPKSTALSAGGRFAVSIASDDRLSVWDLAARQELFRGENSTSSIESVAFTANGQRLVGYGHRRFYHWDLERRGFLGSIQLGVEDTGSVFGLAFLPDQRHFVAVRGSELRVFEVEGFRELLRLRSALPNTVFGSNAIPQLRVSHDGRYVVTNGSDANRLAFLDLHLHLALGRIEP